jgi:ATP-dependent DNA helicase RecQ
MTAPLDTLRRVFGYSSFRGPQEEIIGHLIGGGDALVLMPTGGGKSLCYQIPAMLRTGVGVVVSPLIALMQDQVDALLQAGVRAAFLNSSQDFATASEIERRLRDDELDLVYVAPERLLTDRFLALMDHLQERGRLALFAIDEAHCVSQWGHDFRPEYIQLSALHQRYPSVPRIALTATADQLTRQEIIARLGLDAARVFISSFDRPNIRYTVVERDNPRRQLFDFLAGYRGTSGIVYCLSRKKVDETAAWLGQQGIAALPYHAGLDAGTRQHNQQRFLREDGIVMVATIAFGMGIDKPDVRFVAHLDLPKSLEAYYQETGRAGRDGEPAEAWMTYGLNDVVIHRMRIDESMAGEEQKRVERSKLDALLAWCETATCRRALLLRYFSEDAAACGNCDTCLDPPQLWDGTVAAQKAMSAALRTGQRFGAGHLVDILRGKATEKVEQFGHAGLPTFGAGRRPRRGRLAFGIPPTAGRRPAARRRPGLWRAATDRCGQARAQGRGNADAAQAAGKNPRQENGVAGTTIRARPASGGIGLSPVRCTARLALRAGPGTRRTGLRDSPRQDPARTGDTPARKSRRPAGRSRHRPGQGRALRRSPFAADGLTRAIFSGKTAPEQGCLRR